MAQSQHVSIASNRDVLMYTYTRRAGRDSGGAFSRARQTNITTRTHRPPRPAPPPPPNLTSQGRRRRSGSMLLTGPLFLCMHVSSPQISPIYRQPNYKCDKPYSAHATKRIITPPALPRTNCYSAAKALLSTYRL